MMGVGEGVTYPSIQNMIRSTVPESKRSRALAFIYSGERQRRCRGWEPPRAAPVVAWEQHLGGT